MSRDDERPVNKEDGWPILNADLLTEEDKEIYLQRCKAVSMHRDGVSVKEITEITGIAISSIYYFYGRCQLMAGDGEVLGYRALRPRQHVVPYFREKDDTPKLPEAQGGHSGLFGKLLRKYPDLEFELLTRINKEAKRNLIHEFKLRPKTLHAIFLKYLREIGHPENEWPFNTKWHGRTTITNYMRRVLHSNVQNTALKRGGEEAKVNIHLGLPRRTVAISAEEPYDILEADSHYIDCHLVVMFRNPDGTYSPVSIRRLWILALICRASTAIISYRFVFRSEVSADDVILLLKDALKPEHERPTPTVEGLIYPKNGGLPKEVIPECRGALWSSLMLDGALAHLAMKVRERARRELGFSINWGAPGVPARRSRVEGFFRNVSAELFKRYVSTTGSSPHNGRAKNGEELAKKYQLKDEDAKHLLDVTVAMHNIMPSEGLFYLSPLEYIRQKIHSDEGGFIFRYLVSEKHSEGRAVLNLVKEVTVRGDLKKGRLPYIQYEGVRYTNLALRDAAMLIGKRIQIEVDESDLRQVRAFTLDGLSLGILQAAGKWSLTKHDLRTRKAIRSLASERVLFVVENEDPVQAYMKHLASVKRNNSNKSPSIGSSDAKEAKRVFDAAGVELSFSSATADHEGSESNTSFAKAEGVMSKPMPDLSQIIRGGKDE